MERSHGSRTILGLCGSLRAGSLNRALLDAAEPLLPEGYALERHDLGALPFYRAELDGDVRPEPVQHFRAALARAHGVLIASPEYNHGIPGVLKNAVDWASRPAWRSPLRDKPVTLMSASPGRVGGARGQQALKGVLLGTGAAVHPTRELAVGQAKQVLQSGRLTDDGLREQLAEQLQSFTRWVEALQAYGANAAR